MTKAGSLKFSDGGFHAVFAYVSFNAAAIAALLWPLKVSVSSRSSTGCVIRSKGL